MRVVLQRVTHASVSIDNETVGAINQGYMLLVGFAPDDNDEKLDYLVHKIVNLRVFEDENGKMTRACKMLMAPFYLSRNLPCMLIRGTATGQDLRMPLSQRSPVRYTTGSMKNSGQPVFTWKLVGLAQICRSI